MWGGSGGCGCDSVFKIFQLVATYMHLSEDAVWGGRSWGTCMVYGSHWQIFDVEDGMVLFMEVAGGTAEQSNTVVVVGGALGFGNERVNA